jgi:uncharacterized membrane protein YkoI
MAAAERFAFAAFLAFVLAGAPVRADDAVHPAHTDTAHPAHAEAEDTCLTQKERRAETESGRLIRLATAMHAVKRRMAGTVVRARLCHGHDGLVYVLTVLAHDGKVAQIAVDALKGTFVGDR